MSRKNNPLSQRASLSLIAADTKLFRDFVLDSPSEDFRSSAVLALMPYLSAFAYESANYIERTDSAATRVLKPNKEMLLWSRMRVKLTEDKYKTPTEVLENVEELIAINSGWFFEGHRGISGQLAKLIQPDVGVCFVNDECVYTTHVAFLNLGLTKEALSDSSLTMDNLGPFLHDRSVNVGRYIGLLADRLNIDAHAPRNPLAPPPRIRDRDMKSRRLYESVARRVAPGQHQTSILLTWMLSQVNVARVIVPLIAGQNDIAALKIRFVILYQNALSLQKLVDEEEESPFLLPNALELITSILDAESVQNVLQYRDLRNDFVHYGVRKRMSPQLSARLPLFGLVEAHTKGRSFEDMVNDVDRGLERFSEGLRTLLPSRLISQ